MRLVGRAKDKNKNKNIQAEDRRKFNIGKQKQKNKVYKPGKVDDRVQILQPARSRKTEMVLNQPQKIRLKNSRQLNFGYKLNFDQLADMHHTRN